jgi:predicted membrane channel-forming protein YqfA (hemolysin III family)
VGLALVGIGMGLHLVAGTLNQAALARGRAALAALGWLIAAALFVAFVAAPTIGNEVTRVEVGYFLAAALLCGLLSAVYARGPASEQARYA